MKFSRKDLLAAIAVGAVFFLSSAVAPAQQSSAQLSSEQIARIVASPDRSEADRTNDLRRKPEQMLGFVGIRPARSQRRRRLHHGVAGPSHRTLRYGLR